MTGEYLKKIPKGWRMDRWQGKARLVKKRIELRALFAMRPAVGVYGASCG